MTRQKPKGWVKEPQRKSMAARGISSSPRSGIWFESRGLGLMEMFSLAKMLDFGGLTKTEAKGYNKDSYNSDASRMVILPVSQVENTVGWLKTEWDNGNNARKQQLVRLSERTIREIQREIPKYENPRFREELNQSRQLYRDFVKEHKVVK